MRLMLLLFVALLVPVVLINIWWGPGWAGIDGWNGDQSGMAFLLLQQLLLVQYYVTDRR